MSSRTSKDSEDNVLLDSPFESASGLLEPLSIDDVDLWFRHTMLWDRLQTSTRSWMRRRTKALLKHRFFNYKARLHANFSRRPRISRLLLYLTVSYLSFLGIVHLFGNIQEMLNATYSDDIDWILHHWGRPGEATESWAHWPTDTTGNINPVNCHSHNDYWRPIPLYSAINAGCTGAEADVWLIDNELYVGHTVYALTANRTLRNLYIEPLLDLLKKQNSPVTYQPHESPPVHVDSVELNGIFDVEPTQSFVLLIDFKTDGPAFWWKLLEQLAPLREKGFLTHFNGSKIVQKPITIVGTGNVPFELVTANESYRHVFFDAPLSELADLSSQWPNPNRAQDPTRAHQRSPPPQTPRAGLDQEKPSTPLEHSIYDPTNSYYASTSFSSSIGRVWGSRLTQKQLQLIRGQIRGAHQRGLRVRYWSLPQWPIGLRNHVWHILLREGVDMLNVDDLRYATRRDWRKKKSWFY